MQAAWHRGKQVLVFSSCTSHCTEVETGSMEEIHFSLSYVNGGQEITLSHGSQCEFGDMIPANVLHSNLLSPSKIRDIKRECYVGSPDNFPFSPFLTISNHVKTSFENILCMVSALQRMQEVIFYSSYKESEFFKEKF